MAIDSQMASVEQTRRELQVELSRIRTEKEQATSWVTHFDDLNTYAFLDLIVGLLDVEGQRRQFVISTCDEKLLYLAQQKFKHLGSNARFIRFTAIGSDGPVTEAM